MRTRIWFRILFIAFWMAGINLFLIQVENIPAATFDMAWIEGNAGHDRVTVCFTHPVTVESATEASRYSFDGGLTFTTITLDATQRKVTLHTSPQSPGTTYHLTVSEIVDPDGNTLAPTTKTFRGWIQEQGYALREHYGNLPGAQLSYLTSSEKYLQGNFDYTEKVLLAEARSNIEDAYGQRLYGWITAPQSGEFTFFLASDDASELWLSIDDNPAYLRSTPIAHIDGRTNRRQWDAPSEIAEGKQQSDAIPLVEQQRYFFQVLHKEGENGDHAAAGWVRPGQDPNILENVEVIPGSALSMWINPDRPIITEQPTSLEGVEYFNVSFRVTANAHPSLENPPALTYQWQKEGQDIPGAQQATYTIAMVSPAHAGQYRCVVALMVFI